MGIPHRDIAVTELDLRPPIDVAVEPLVKRLTLQSGGQFLDFTEHQRQLDRAGAERIEEGAPGLDRERTGDHGPHIQTVFARQGKKLDLQGQFTLHRAIE
jgi:hypothetical protein